MEHSEKRSDFFNGFLRKGEIHCFCSEVYLGLAE